MWLLLCIFLTLIVALIAIYLSKLLVLSDDHLFSGFHWFIQAEVFNMLILITKKALIHDTFYWFHSCRENEKNYHTPNQ